MEIPQEECFWLPTPRRVGQEGLYLCAGTWVSRVGSFKGEKVRRPSQYSRERGQERAVHSSQQEVVMVGVKCNNMDRGSGFYGLWLQFLGGKGGAREVGKLWIGLRSESGGEVPRVPVPILALERQI